MKRKNLKAYVRLDKNGQPIGGSMIYRDKQPYGKFKPLVNPYGDVCCPPSGSGGCSSSLWLNTITDNQSIYGPSVIDADCNVYRAGRFSSGGSIVMAFNGAGDVIWSKAYTPVESLSQPYEYVANLCLVNNVLYLILIPTNGASVFNIIVKIDPATGNVIDTFAPTSIEAQVPGQGFNQGQLANVDANGDIYVVGGSRITGVTPNPIPTVVKISGTTGTVIDYFCEGDPLFATSSFYYGTRLLQDASGNFIFLYASATLPTYTVAYKLDSSLNLIWAVILPDFVEIYANGSTVDIALDASGNIYGTDYENQIIFRLNGATGAVDWVVSLSSLDSTDSTYITNINIGTNGSIYLTGAASPDFLNNQGVSDKTCFSVVNLSSVDGSPNWGYGIDLGTPQDMWWGWNNGISTISNSVLLAGSTSSVLPDRPFNFFKLKEENLAYTVGAYPLIPATGLVTTPQIASSVALNPEPQTLTWGTTSVTMVATDVLPTITKTIITV